jgi:membrane-bound serine protease (ClpP class)
MILIYFKLFPRTFIGRRLILGNTQRQEKGFTSFTQSNYENLIGCSGESATVLRPSGMVVLNGKKYSAVTEGEFIEKGAKIMVEKVEGSRIVVRASSQPLDQPKKEV